MLSQISNTNHARVNELKGNLLEYSTAWVLAERWGGREDFLSSLDPQYLELLGRYEREIKLLDQDLANSLPLMGEDLANQLIQDISLRGEKKVRLLGKESAAKKNEGDLLLIGEKEQQFVSLKFCKTGSYVNTKSGGMGSFLSKYFHSKKAEAWQKKLSEVNELSFHELGAKLYERIDERWEGHFNSAWEKAGGAQLPGELDEEGSSWLFLRYEKILNVLVKAFQEFSLEKESFEKGLLNLCGFSDECDFQLWLNYSPSQKKWETHTLKLEDFVPLLRRYEFLPSGKAKSSFSLSLGDYCLQIRIKPMNVFTTKSFKVNCSLKYIR